MMKKLLLIAIVAIVSMVARAESGDICAGVQFNYGSKHTLMGLGANMVIEPVNRFRVFFACRIPKVFTRYDLTGI